MTRRRRRRGGPDENRASDDLPPERSWRVSAAASELEKPRPRWRSALIFAVGWAAAGASMMTLVSGIDFVRTHEKPIEQVTVIDAHKVWGANGCYRKLQSWVVTFRSANPPGDFPAVYQDIWCHEPDVGATYPAVRRLNGTQFTTYLNPATATKEVFVTVPAISLAILVPALFVGRLGWLAASPRLKRWWVGTSVARSLGRRRH